MTNPEQGNDQAKLNRALEHFLKPLLGHPDALTFNVVQGTHIMMVELTVNSEDYTQLSAEENPVFQALQHILTVTRFERKVSLELLEPSES